MTGKLAEKVAIVTGSSKGIGRAIAQRLAEDGATVVINYARSGDKAEEVVATIKQNGGKAIAVQADMGKIPDIESLFEHTIEQFGKVDILVNNAGVGAGGTIAEVTEEDYEKVFSVNVKGVLFALQQAAKNLENNGRVINVSSTTTIYTSPGLAIYAASKNAIKMFTEILAQEIGNRGITVNTVLPGPTSPGMFDSMPSEVQEEAANSSPFKRIGSGEDIADVVAFLASDDARWITSQHITANGGAKI
ncbi:MAG: glucose 1-dehydrogenase [Cyanobacteria bacterium J06641_2]